MKKKRLFKLTLVATLLAVLLTGCGESQDEPFTTVGTTEGTAVITTELIIGGNDPIIACEYYFYSYAEFEHFYEVFSTVNSESVVTVAWETPKSDSLYYYFCAGLARMSVVQANTYDLDFPRPKFAFEIYFSKSDTVGVNRDDCDYAVWGETFALDQPIQSFEEVELREPELRVLDTRKDGSQFEELEYDLVLGDTVLMTFSTYVKKDEVDFRHQELCQMVLDRLVCMSGE